MTVLGGLSWSVDRMREKEKKRLFGLLLVFGEF